MGDQADWLFDQALKQDAQARDLFEETRTYIVEEVTLDTPKALRIQIVGGGLHWVSRGQISPDSPVQNKGDSGKLIISEWLAGRLDDEARGLGRPWAATARDRQTKDALRTQAAAVRERRGFKTP